MVLVSILAHAEVRPSERSTPLYQRALVRISTLLIDQMTIFQKFEVHIINLQKSITLITVVVKIFF